jgi:hypothetical protein
LELVLGFMVLGFTASERALAFTSSVVPLGFMATVLLRDFSLLELGARFMVSELVLVGAHDYDLSGEGCVG